MSRHRQSDEPNLPGPRLRRLDLLGWLPEPGRRSRFVLRGLAVLLAVAVTGGSLAAYAKYSSLWNGIKRVNVQADLTGKRPPADPNALNLLVIGSDSRAGINGKIGGSKGIYGARSDTIMVLHIAPGAHQVVALSIPRDSVVPILNCAPEAGTGGQTARPANQIEQVNASFANGGPGCLWKTVEQTTGIRINDFVELTFDGFEKVIDDLGGVNVCLPEAVDDPMSGLHLTAGRHRVWGAQALAFWRTREDLGTGSDPQRIERDQFLMVGLLQGLEHSKLIRDPGTLLRVIDTLTSHDYVTTDTGLTAEGMLRLGEDLRGISADSVQFVTVPWTIYSGNAQWIDSSETPTYGEPDWVQWVQPEANSLFSAISHDSRLPAAAKTKVKTVRPADVAVQVLNGTPSAGLATSTAASLTDRGFRVVGSPADAASDTYTSTVIEYRSAAQLPAARTLADLFSHVTLKRDPSLTGSTLSLILGSTFTKLAAPSDSAASNDGAASNDNAAISNLAGTYGGIRGSTNICADSNAFAGPDGS
jgi:LCP family protein required for cell wall assembly